MICASCGLEIPDNMKFCTNCGRPLPAGGNEEETPAGQASLVGFSDKINDPAFASYIKQGTAWIFIFTSIISAIAIVGFYIYGQTSVEMDNPQALFIGLGIAGMFLTIAIISNISRLAGKTYDMVVIDKKIEKLTRRQKSGEDYYIEKFTRYTVVYRTDKGKVVKKWADDDATKYNYFQIGDRVRHHKGLNTLEKYDKTGDKIIFCNACSTLNDINDDKCCRCSCPLLK